MKIYFVSGQSGSRRRILSMLYSTQQLHSSIVPEPEESYLTSSPLLETEQSQGDPFFHLLLEFVVSLTSFMFSLILMVLHASRHRPLGLLLRHTRLLGLSEAYEMKSETGPCIAISYQPAPSILRTSPSHDHFGEGRSSLVDKIFRREMDSDQVYIMSCNLDNALPLLLSIHLSPSLSTSFSLSSSLNSHFSSHLQNTLKSSTNLQSSCLKPPSFH